VVSNRMIITNLSPLAIPCMWWCCIRLLSFAIWVTNYVPVLSELYSHLSYTPALCY
jgi:hypothetical protein